ncbi:hypothetical protein ARMGADRAFT_1080269 [Armillaria gallica]|uniref:Uncharacterized protein n=1 Tax=Armillaria gallica TaxID=47427 RepID=A0A2H3DVG3_ARMGA|nr:hypothetical protein ARMGADRAFT_1080269 [Armillaria gallica]
MAKPNSLKQLELDAVEKVSLRLSVEALYWLFSMSSNPAVQTIVMESIGGLPMGALVEVEDVFHGSPSIIDVQKNLLMSLAEQSGTDWDCFRTLSMSSGMKRKLERLLRSCMFISGANSLWYVIDIQDQLDRNEFGATLVTQIPKLCLRPEFLQRLDKPNVFLHNVLSLETSARFSPIVWKNLIQSATDSWDPDLFNIDDQFPMLLCSAMARSSIVRTDIPKQQFFASLLVVDFEQAVEYFPEMALKYMMCWLSQFDLLPGERLGCRVLAASIHLMIHRLSQSAAGTDIAQTSEISFLRKLLGILYIYTPENFEPVWTWKILESVIMNTPILSQDTVDSNYHVSSSYVLDNFGEIMQECDLASHIHAPSPALQLLVTFMTMQWSTLPTSTRTRDVLSFLIICLQEHFWPAYDAFQQGCLNFFATQPVSSCQRSSWSASLFRAYVIGIAVAIDPSRDDPEKKKQMILQAIDHLHQPANLFLVCSTLAMFTRSDDSVPELAGKSDIMTALAGIRTRHTAWGDCRQSLRELAADKNCFVGLEGEERDIEQRRSNMRAAIERLEAFLDRPPQATASSELPEPPQPQSWSDRIGRLLLWRRPQQQEGEHPLTERGMRATHIPTNASSPC